MGERFTSLSNNHPMGNYLEALYHTGYYYTFIGVAQVLAAILLLIPRTVIFGALLYLPIIVNIAVLSYSVRFDGSLLTSPLMVMANLFILFWNFDKLQPIFSKQRHSIDDTESRVKKSNKFPFKFFGGVVLVVAIVIVGNLSLYKYGTMPRNSTKDCEKQFKNTNRTQAGYNFCNCIHTQGNSLRDCIEKYSDAKDDIK